MSPPEIGFLALGIALGLTVGVAVFVAMRPRSFFRPVVKVTVTPLALAPREAAGLAARFDGPVRGSPDDDARGGAPGAVQQDAAAAVRLTAPSGADPRTRVPVGPAVIPSRAVGIPIAGGGDGPAGPPALPATAVAVAERPAAAAGAGTGSRAAALATVDIRPQAVAAPVLSHPVLPEPHPLRSADLVGIPIVAGRAPSGESHSADEAAGAAVRDACADERTKASAACAAADAARDAARILADRLRDARRAHADLRARVDEAGILADPRRLAAEKERLHAQFQAAHAAAASSDAAEAAARVWLTAVSAANKSARDAARQVQAGTEELRARAVALEQLDLEASAARITAERTEDACRTARESLATCEEQQRPAVVEHRDDSGPLDAHWPGGAEPSFERQQQPQASDDRLPVVLLVLRGDAAAREALVASLAGADAAAAAAWHVRIAKFVDAVTARAIEDGFIDADEEHSFWRLFSGEEQRAIVQALSSLGFRFDGMRGFADDRVPSARDLSLAVGYAGLDRMRIRTWPGEAGLASLFDGASVRADVWLATQADDLSLRRVEGALGPRAAGLSDLWEAWGRVRPAMLEER